ncbi:MAG: hypothetical protein K2N87_11220 [Eubacterium sp.]|nr:hypothetical protein [Eubacterium sp.]
MHINEQRPMTLKQTLNRYFSSVYVWSGKIEAIEQLSDIGMQQIENEVTAVAGKHILAEELLKLVSNGRLKKQEVCVQIACEGACIRTDGSKPLVIPVKIKNEGKGVLKSQQPYPVHLSYHIRKDDGEMVVFDGMRSVLNTSIQPGMCTQELLEVSVQELSDGEYWIEPDLVQEGWMWFREVCEISAKIRLIRDGL